MTRKKIKKTPLFLGLGFFIGAVLVVVNGHGDTMSLLAAAPLIGLGYNSLKDSNAFERW